MTGTRHKTTDAPFEEDLLSTSPFDGDLEEQLAAAPRPQRRLPSATLFLGAGVLIAGGFLGGVQADQQWGAKGSTNNLALPGGRPGGQGGGFPGGFPGGQGGGFGGQRGGFGGQRGGFGGGQGGGGAQGAAGSGTSGTVKLVDGDTIYVQTANGIVRVKTTGSTKVTIAKKSTAKNLKTGSQVVVQGTAGQDGTVTATSVSQGG